MMTFWFAVSRMSPLWISAILRRPVSMPAPPATSWMRPFGT